MKLQKSNPDSIVNRHDVLKAAAAIGAGLFVGRVSTAAEAPRLVIEETKIINWKPPLYHGWPTLARRKNGELLLVWSGGRESHVYPFGRVELMRSQDNGLNWRWPQVLIDGPMATGFVKTRETQPLPWHAPTDRICRSQ